MNQDVAPAPSVAEKENTQPSEVAAIVEGQSLRRDNKDAGFTFSKEDAQAITFEFQPKANPNHDIIPEKPSEKPSIGAQITERMTVDMRKAEVALWGKIWDHRANTLKQLQWQRKLMREMGRDSLRGI